MTTVIGVDISKASVAACLLTDKPQDVQMHYRQCTFFKHKANASGVTELLSLKPEVAVLEPTGVNYAKLWGTHLARAGVTVYLVGHKQLRRYREDYLSLPDKDDDADALALACYWFDHHLNPRRFVQVRDREIVRLRELSLRLCHLNRVQSPIINRARQDLAWQFPEVALCRSRSNQGSVPLLWGWLAGERKSAKYDRLYSQSVGLGLTETVHSHAQRICDLQREERAIELEMHQLLSHPRYFPYRKVFARFGFGFRVQALILSQIYPFENYLDPETGRPIVEVWTGRKSGKPTKRHLSERRFCRSLGLSPVREQSGDKDTARLTGGSDVARTAIWQWLFTRIEPVRSRPKNSIGQRLGELMDAEKDSGRPSRLVRSRVCAKAVKLLFKELATEIGQ